MTITMEQIYKKMEQIEEAIKYDCLGLMIFNDGSGHLEGYQGKSEIWFCNFHELQDLLDLPISKIKREWKRSIKDV